MDPLRILYAWPISRGSDPLFWASHGCIVPWCNANEARFPLTCKRWQWLNQTPWLSATGRVICKWRIEFKYLASTCSSLELPAAHLFNTFTTLCQPTIAQPDIYGDNGRPEQWPECRTLLLYALVSSRMGICGVVRPRDGRTHHPHVSIPGGVLSSVRHRRCQ